jgi:AraC-like DNA-binding protein
MISRLLDLILIRILRTWASSDDAEPGWLRGAMDKRISRVLTAIHTRPEQPWTVPELAQLAFMSRSTLATRFQQLVGHSPADYVATCRMDRAMDLLRLGDAPVDDIAERIGYQSPASFTRAFQKRVGLTPHQWRQKHRTYDQDEI